MRYLCLRSFISLAIASLLAFTLQAAERSVDGAYGPVTVEGTPKRVVALGENALDAALSVGVQPVGALASRGGTDIPDYLKERSGPVALVGTVREPSLEAVLALQPDLILASSGLARAIRQAQPDCPHGRAERRNLR